MDNVILSSILPPIVTSLLSPPLPPPFINLNQNFFPFRSSILPRASLTICSCAFSSSLPRRTDKFLFLLFLVGGLRLLALSTLLCLAVCWSLGLQPWGIPRPVIWPQIMHILLALPHMLSNMGGCTSHSIGSLDGLIIGVLTIFFGPVFPIGEKWAHWHIGQLHCSHSTEVRGTRMFSILKLAQTSLTQGWKLALRLSAAWNLYWEHLHVLQSLDGYD